MGLLQRISAVVNGNFKKNTANNATIQSFGQEFNSQALKKYNLTQDVFSPNPYSDIDINDNNLALVQPVRFIRKYANSATIQNALEKNPNIARILKENGLPVKFDLENINSIVMSHLIPTSKTAQKVYCKMGHNANELSYLHLTQAALLHDIGKCFIPGEILNKKGKLTPQERRIIELHNRLSYEILKTTDLNPQVAKLAFEHHDYQKNLKRTQENQALTISDVYCALKEHRPYKKPLSDLCAKTILYDMGTKGSFDTRYINYLSA